MKIILKWYPWRAEITQNRDGLKAYFYKVVGKIWEIEIKIKHYKKHLQNE